MQISIVHLLSSLSIQCTLCISLKEFLKHFPNSVYNMVPSRYVGTRKTNLKIQKSLKHKMHFTFSHLVHSMLYNLSRFTGVSVLGLFLSCKYGVIKQSAMMNLKVPKSKITKIPSSKRKFHMEHLYKLSKSKAQTHQTNGN